MLQQISQHTKSLEPPTKPAQSHHNDDDVNEAQIRHDGCNVNEDLLIGL